MTPHDDSAWDDLSEALGLETKPKPKPYDPAPVVDAPHRTPGEPAPFPDNPWPEDPNPDASGLIGFADLPDAPLADDDHDTLIDPNLANEDFASDDDESSEGESEGDHADGEQPGGKKKRRRRRRRKGGGGSDGAADGSGEESELPEANEPAVSEAPRSVADAIKQVVANWTVPGWKEIVAGLYRPGGSNSERGDRERDR